jgi:uncharacterized membrane-anchored protein
MLFRRNKNDNEWLAADRRERRKTALVVIGAFALLAAILAFLLWAAFAHHS